MTGDHHTIFALSSGQLPSGIAIVRVSGSRALQALRVIAGTEPAARYAKRAVLHGTDGEPIDDGLVFWFPGPHSATGEDVAEFHCHGGRAVTAALFAALATVEGMRPAEPGEFSRRAFENGKLDLVAAEALDDLIHADTERQRRQAFRQLEGLLGNRARAWRQQIIDASALVEAGIDFSDEGDVAGELLAPALETVRALRSEMAKVLAQSQQSERLRDGLTVAIAGPPNVGKSTLLNCLARREVAIVSPYAGTTRDVIEVALDLEGYPVTVIDTAGLRESDDPVEQEGIRRARARAADADIVLWLSDLDGGPAAGRPAGAWTVRSKADLGKSGIFDFQLSAMTGEGIDALTAAIARFAADQFPAELGLITRARHRSCVENIVAALDRACEESELELVAEHLRSASTGVGRLLGRVDVEDVLGAIFSRFCIGK